MKPLRIIESLTTADGKELILLERAGTFYITIDHKDLMSSQTHGSEEALARLALASLEPTGAPEVLVGGLGMGFTLHAVLDLLTPAARVTVAEVFPEVVRWNREIIGHLAGHPLADPRVTVTRTDVARLLRHGSHDVILLDVDNGPEALTLATNRRLYEPAGLLRLRRSLRQGGVLAIWSAASDRAFVVRLRRAGFDVRSETVRARGRGKGARHTIILARCAHTTR